MAETLFDVSEKKEADEFVEEFLNDMDIYEERYLLVLLQGYKLAKAVYRAGVPESAYIA